MNKALSSPSDLSSDSPTWLHSVSPDWNENPGRAGLVVCLLLYLQCLECFLVHSSCSAYNGGIKMNEGMNAEKDGRIHAGI